jgi:hypothetical protein
MVGMLMLAEEELSEFNIEISVVIRWRLFCCLPVMDDVAFHFAMR